MRTVFKGLVGRENETTGVVIFKSQSVVSKEDLFDRIDLLNAQTITVFMIEQIIRPTGLLDPEVEVRPTITVFSVSR